MDDAQYDRIIGDIYEAAIDPRMWETVMVRIADVLGSMGGHLFVWDKVNQRPGFSAVGRLTQEGDEAYTTYYYAIDPNRLLVQSSPVGKWLLNHQHYDDAFVSRSEFYNDFLRPLGNRWLVGTCLASTDEVEGFMSFHRGPHKTPFNEKDAQLLSRLSGHMERAILLLHKTLHLHGQAEMGVAALDGMELGVIIADTGGRIRFANRQAEEILQRQNGISVLNGALALNGDGGELKKLLEEAVHKRQGGAMQVERPAAGMSYQLMVAPLVPHSTLLNSWQQPLALVLISDPDRQPVVSSRQFATLFHFTPAETRLALALLQGLSPAEYAEQYGVAMATVRTQLRAILAKTGTRRQAELVRVLGSLPGIRQ